MPNPLCRIQAIVIFSRFKKGTKRYYFLFLPFPKFPLTKNNIMQIREFHVRPEQGLSKTLELMNELERKAIQSQFFQESIKSLFEHLKFSKIMLYEKVWEFVRKNFKYVQDRYDEEIKNPLLMFHFKTGDCDDFSLFIKSSLKVLGIRSNYILLGKNENEFTHIAVITNDGTIIDGSNELFNWIHTKYKFKKVI